MQGLLALVLPFVFGGCITTMPFGSPPRQGALERLKPGQSTAADVLLILGEPRGDGAVRWTPAVSSRKVWYYEYIEAGSGRADTKILLMFFDQDRYDGYLWFSSASLVGKR